MERVPTVVYFPSRQTAPSRLQSVSADTQGGVIWNRDASRGWFIGLQNDVTTLLMDLPVVPMFAERLDDCAAREVARDFHAARKFYYWNLRLPLINPSTNVQVADGKLFTG